MTRLIAAGLRAGEKKHLQKQLVQLQEQLMQGVDRIIHRLRKLSIGEQVRLLKYFSDET